MKTILNRARAADEGTTDPTVVGFFGATAPGFYRQKAEKLENSLNLCYMRQAWPADIEGHWTNLRHAVRDGIHPEALDRAEAAILPHAEDDLPRQLIDQLRQEMAALR